MGKKIVEILEHKKFMDYSTQKSTKLGVYIFQGSFDLHNESFWLSGPIESIANVLTNVQKIFREKIVKILHH